MKPIWSGSISFGLLEIPIHLYSAISEHTFGFRILCGTCHTPLKNMRWCEHCKKEVSWENTVKGLKKTDGSFFIMTQESVEKLKPEKLDTIEIKEFVDQSEIEILYIDNHYYMMPAKEKDKSFNLFAHALKKSKKVGIAQFVMREKEYVVAISFYKNILLLNTLHYHYEIRDIGLEKKTKTTNPTSEELSLALLLINKFSHKNFTLAKYKDTFVEKLKKALKSAKKTKKVSKKQSGKKTHTKTEAKKSLTASLKESLREQARS